MTNKGMKRCSISLVTRGMQIKNTMRHFTPTSLAIIKRTNVGEVVEELDLLYIAGRNVKWCGYCRKGWQFLKKLNTELPYNLAISLLGIYPRDLKTYGAHTKTCTQMFTAALFIIAKR